MIIQVRVKRLAPPPSRPMTLLLFLLLLLLLPFDVSPHNNIPKSLRDNSNKNKILPNGTILAAYATDSTSLDNCNITRIVKACRDGVNVLIWFSINLVAVNNKDSKLKISGGPSFECVRNVQSILRHQKDVPSQITHLISIGGWDAPHPNATIANGTQWYEIFHEWNKEGLYDGIDWDIEGNDSFKNPYHHSIHQDVMNLIYDFSIQARKNQGYIVSMVPPQSYFDIDTEEYDLRLDHVDEWRKDFPYHGRNVYTYLTHDLGFVPDMIIVQLYEGWSRANNDITYEGINAVDWLINWVKRITAINAITNDTGRQLKRAHVDTSRLLIGISRGSADGSGKSLYLRPNDIASAFFSSASPSFRGVAFWNINIDADGGPVNGTIDERCSLGVELGRLLGTKTRRRRQPTLSSSLLSSSVKIMSGRVVEDISAAE